MKLVLKLALMLPMVSLMSGCWDRMELNDLAIVTALTFDQADNGQVRTTVQIILPETQSSGSIGGGGGGGASPKTVARSSTGVSAADAVSKLQSKVSRRLFWGQCKVFIFSQDIAKAGIQDLFDFLIRHPQLREGGYMYVSEGTAADILESSPPVGLSSANTLLELIRMRLGLAVTMEELSIMLKSESRAAALPMITSFKSGKSDKVDQDIPFLQGTAVFKEDKMVGRISAKATRGIMWLRHDADEFTVTFLKDKQYFSVKPFQLSVQLTPKIEKGVWSMKIRVKTAGDLIENNSSWNTMNPAFWDTLERAFAEDVKGRVQLALHEIQQQKKTDIVDFAVAFHRKYPKVWEKNKRHWDKMFPEVKTSVEVEAHIIRPGNVSAPGGMPREEARER